MRRNSRNRHPLPRKRRVSNSRFQTRPSHGDASNYLARSLTSQGASRLTSITVRHRLFIMRNNFTKSFLFVASLLLVSESLWAHHGQGLSFDTNHMWTTWGKIEEFSYINPHPAVKFSRTDKDGNVEHWGAEVSNNPSRLARVGWTKSRCLAALQPGTRVKLYVGTSLVGGHIGIVELIESEKGELLCSEREAPIAAVDMDGVPDGYQPKPQDQKQGEK
jgi:Family of unknown function (DUF6152)